MGCGQGGDAIARPVGQQQATIVIVIFPVVPLRTVNCLTLRRRKICEPLFRQAQREAEGMQMRAWMGIAMVAIGLIWSVAVMSKLVPVDGSEMRLAATSRPAE
jgi:hypothetical protein